MNYIPYRKASLLIPFNDAPHLFAVMNDQCRNNMCLIIMITSLREGKYHDPACILDIGDHSFIKHRSYLLYRMAEVTRIDRISRLVSKNYYIPRDDFLEGTFKRISDGIRLSDDTPLRIFRYADANGI